MNLDQLARAARQELDAYRADGTTSSMWSDEEVYAAVNSALEKAYRLMRMSGSHHVRKVINSDDSAAAQSGRYANEAYAPSSLSVVADTDTYTLPPDFVSIVSLIPKPSSTDSDSVNLVRFRPSQPNDTDWENAVTVTDDDTASVAMEEDTYLYTVIGRTLHIRPTPAVSFDVTMTYNYRPNKLRRTATGTITTTSTAVTGSSTVWLSTAAIRLPAELIPGSSGSATVPTPDVNAQYPRFSTITSNTAATLTDALASDLAGGTGHIVSMVPLLPDEHHTWLAQYAAAILRRKTDIQASGASKQELETQLMSEIQPEVRTHQLQRSEHVEAFEP